MHAIAKPEVTMDIWGFVLKWLWLVFIIAGLLYGGVRNYQEARRYDDKRLKVIAYLDLFLATTLLIMVVIDL
jgi:high-affinity Fe2+/Pb2+ permease